MDHVFDDLSALVTAPAYDGRKDASVLVLRLLSTAFTGLAFGLGFAVAIAIAG